MASFPAPAAFGRGVVTTSRTALGPECDGWHRITVDDDVVATPRAVADQLHELWLGRRPVIVVLAGDAAALKAPERCDLAPWQLDPTFEFSRERLQYLVWSNNYDYRGAEPIWWHGRRAVRLGATAGGPADAVLPNGRPAWCDGGPRQPLAVDGSTVVVHREAIEAGQLRPDDDRAPSSALAPDQLGAVSHAVGPARVIAPAGSGKTRVLTERLRHLLADRGVTPSTVTAVAYNVRAARELSERTVGLDAHIRTLNSLGLAVVNGSGPFAAEGPRRKVIEEFDVRQILASLVEVPRHQNIDPHAPYIDALSAIRLGLTDPKEAEEAIPDATGIAEVFDRYRAILADRRLLDFDEQIYAAIEVLLRNPEVRARNQRLTRHLLVDEFQDLTPAHLLMLRLLSAPTYDVFGVGDDDQVIYAYAGANPDFLIDYGRYFPGATPYAVEINYRCPPAIVDAAGHLLSYNNRRVAKTIRPEPGRRGAPADLQVDMQPDDAHAGAATEHIMGWADAGVAWSDMAVLARVNSALLPVQVTLGHTGIPCTTPLNVSILNRTGIRTALAYLRIGLNPKRIARNDIAETIRRPTRYIARNVADLVQKPVTTSIGRIRSLADSLSGGDVDKLYDYADDLENVADAVRTGTTAEALKEIRVGVGLGSDMDALDSSRREADRSTHGDDLAALEQVAALHPDAATFEAWLREAIARPGSADGVTLSTVHRVKGQEWPHVVVFGADAGSFPHRLAGDVEEERRVFHVAITRARDSVVIVADSRAPSPFCAELTGTAPRRAARSRRPAVTVRPLPWERPAPAQAQAPSEPAQAALREWRKETAAREKAPAYVVLSDAHLVGIAAARPSTLQQLARCRGIGPAKLEKYGDEILAVLHAVNLRQ